MDTDYGNDIDLYDEVIRFNRAPVEGWESKVGSKTTVRVLNRPTFASAPLKRWKDDIEFVKNLKDQRFLVHGHAKQLIGNRDKYCDKSNTIFMLEHGKVFDSLKNKYKVTLTKPPTVGFSTIVALLDAGLQPHLYGFDFEVGRPRDHYWHERPDGSWSHDLSTEIKIIKKWGDLKKVIIHQ